VATAGIEPTKTNYFLNLLASFHKFARLYPTIFPSLQSATYASLLPKTPFIMDVHKVAFEPRLLQILEALSTAHFVSIDLEMSGVSSRSAGPSRHNQCLQERYVELKEAAERYQILQIGLTVVQQDSDEEKYTLQPYNFPLNPCIEEKSLDLERIFSFQSGAVDFLLEHGFNMEEPFKYGVPYLSRDEEKLAKQKAKDRNDPNRFADIEWEEGDLQTINFMAKIRKETSQWLKTRRPNYDHISIVSFVLSRWF
jgi:poly(A)-specific ribonuclease